MTHARFLESARFPALDGVRGLSMLGVICHHTYSGTRFFPITHHLYICVDVFFVLSAFLIATLLVRERKNTGHVDLRAFYARRSLRIVPLYLLFVAVAATIGHFAPGPGTTNVAPGLKYLLTFTANWTNLAGLIVIAWTLSAEEQFYLVWPVVERFVARFPRLLLLGLFALANAAYSLAAAQDWVPHQLLMLRVTFLPIALGIGLAYCLDHERGFSAFRRFLAFSPHATWIPALAFFTLWSFGKMDTGIVRVSLQLLFTLSLGSVVVNEEGSFARLCTTPVLRRFGALSYAMYLFHTTVIWAVLPYVVWFGTRKLPYFFFAVLALTWVLGEIVARTIERPLLRLKERVAPSPGKAVPPTPSSLRVAS